MAGEMKAVKDIGWDFISLSKKGFKGAVQSYDSANGGKIALCFNLHEAFVVEDDQGLFGVEDLKEGIIQDASMDVELTGTIAGAHTLAWQEEDDPEEVGYDEEKLNALGLNDFSVKESLKERILKLSALDKMVDMQV